MHLFRDAIYLLALTTVLGAPEVARADVMLYLFPTGGGPATVFNQDDFPPGDVTLTIDNNDFALLVTAGPNDDIRRIRLNAAAGSLNDFDVVVANLPTGFRPEATEALLASK